jgi:hypothetical protein
MEYRSRLPVGSGMGLTTPQSTLMLSPRLQNRLNNYLNHLGSNLASKALPGDEFVAEDVFSLYIASIRMRKLTVMRSEDRGVAGGAPDPAQSEPGCTSAAGRRLTCVRARNRRRDAPVHSRATFVPRRIQFLEELVRCWRDGDASTGCLFALRLLQTAEGRKRLIPAYKNAWWVALRHKDCLARYKVVVKEIVKMAPNALCMIERGTDADWTEAMSLFRARWDDETASQNWTITKYLAKFRDERSK